LTSIVEERNPPVDDHRASGAGCGRATARRALVAIVLALLACALTASPALAARMNNQSGPNGEATAL
jgi:hypothetical protein